MIALIARRRARPLKIAALAFTAGLFVHSAHAAIDGVPLPGGTPGLARSIGIEPAPEPARAMAEFARLLHAYPEGVSESADARNRALIERAVVISNFEILLDGVQPAAQGGVSLSLARQKKDRQRLSAFLEFLGLRLRERKGKWSVERSNDKDAIARVQQLVDIHVDTDTLTSRLNAGETVRIDVPTEAVPVPWSALYWSNVIFDKSVLPRDLVFTILTDRRAALLCRGLLALDDDTLQYLEAHPPIVRRLYESSSSAFGVFGNALRVRGGRVDPPGGAAAAPLWQAVVGEDVGKPERFIRELFEREGGRLAYFYETISRLDADRRAFALGTWFGDERLRRERFRELASASVASVGDWQVGERPFVRSRDDAAIVLTSIRVLPGGMPSEPSARRFWERSFESLDLPDDAARSVQNVGASGQIDAAWLVQQLTSADATQRRQRIDQFTFGQRAFNLALASELGEALIAVRAFARVPALLLALDRAGVRTPKTMADAARKAIELTDRDADLANVALGQYQGALALICRLAAVGAVSDDKADALVTELSMTKEGDERGLSAALVIWLTQTLAPAIGLSAELTESRLIDAAAGLTRAERAVPIVTWEERRYRVDVAQADARRFWAVREAQPTVSLDLVLELEKLRASLLANSLTIGDVRAVASALAAMSSHFAPITLSKEERPAGIDERRNHQQILEAVSRDLAKIVAPRDLRDASRAASRLTPVVDATLADALVALAYVWATGVAESPDVAAAGASLRHDFSLGGPSRDESKRLAWQVPEQDISPGRPWRVKGSILGLDAALGSLALHRVSTDSVAVPTLNGNHYAAFARSFALSNAWSLRDTDQRSLATALVEGLRLVDQATASNEINALLRMVDEVGMDGWRRRAVQWAHGHDRPRVSMYFATKELLRLGGIDAGTDLTGWGMAGSAYSGCLCLSFDTHFAVLDQTGRTQDGRLPSQLPDLNIRVASVLHMHGLPAILARSVLSAVVQSYLDRVKPTDDDDWMTMMQTARAFPDEEIDDAIASLTAGGALVPVAGQN